MTALNRLRFFNRQTGAHDEVTIMTTAVRSLGPLLSLPLQGPSDRCGLTANF